jgi:hypothetical protein
MTGNKLNVATKSYGDMELLEAPARATDNLYGAPYPHVRISGEARSGTVLGALVDCTIPGLRGNNCTLPD